MEKRTVNSIVNLVNDMPRFIILSGDGINCENETAQAFEAAGAVTEIKHVNELIDNPEMLSDFDGMALPGGFSFGDELGSGQLLALKIKHQISDAFSKFVEDGKPIIGICNGFQVLVKLGLLPYPFQEKTVTLTSNQSGEFIDKWVDMDVQQSSICKWTQNFPTTIELPIRHGEGRLVLKQGEEKEIYDKLKENGQIPLTYCEDVNGSYEKIAAICDPTGLILGIMPHPEAFLYNATYRNIHKDPTSFGLGYFFFKNIVDYIKNANGTETQNNDKQSVMGR